jgi:hypothetical protein
MVSSNFFEKCLELWILNILMMIVGQLVLSN